jgi:hypothetical protein
MKKIKLILICLSFLIVFKVYSQNVDIPKTESDSFLKKGNFAVMFELGKLISRTSSFEGYDIATKYHIADYSAIRFSFLFSEGDLIDNTSISNYETYSSYSYEMNLSIQQYFKHQSLVNPFLAFGVIFSQNYHYKTADNNNYSDWLNEWNLGLSASIGTEVFIYNNVAVTGEYLIKAVYNKYREQDFSHSNSYFFSADEKTFKFSGNTARLGFSVYF